MADKGKPRDEDTELDDRDDAAPEQSEARAEAEVNDEGDTQTSDVSDDADDESSDPPDDDAKDDAKDEDEDEDEAEAPAAEAPAQAAREAEAPKGAAWGEPVARFEKRWTWFEARLITFVLVWQILSLVAWVFLNGLSESVAESAGAVFRGAIFAIVLGLGAWFGARKLHEDKRRNLTLLGLGAGIALAIAWRKLAIAGGSMAAFDKSTVNYFDNIKGWLQEGSTLTLLGGLRGLGTRLTLWLALLGGSLATAAGKHIHIDVVFRFLPKRLRVPAAIINYVAAAAVCFAGVWGFFDHIAIESYGARAEDPPGQKLENAAHHIGHHLFFARKQIGLDLRSLPHVLGAQRYDEWMSGAAWNEWLDNAGFEDRFPKEQVDLLHVGPDVTTHTPFVISPAGETTRGALAHTLALVFPFGLLAIGLRFLLRAIMTLSGHLSVDPDEAHKEEIGHGGAIELGNETETAKGGV